MASVAVLCDRVDDTGGAERYWATVIPALAARGIRVDLAGRIVSPESGFGVDATPIPWSADNERPSAACSPARARVARRTQARHRHHGRRVRPARARRRPRSGAALDRPASRSTCVLPERRSRLSAVRRHVHAQDGGRLRRARAAARLHERRAPQNARPAIRPARVARSDRTRRCRLRFERPHARNGRTQRHRGRPHLRTPRRRWRTMPSASVPSRNRNGRPCCLPGGSSPPRVCVR